MLLLKNRINSVSTPVIDLDANPLEVGTEARLRISKKARWPSENSFYSNYGTRTPRIYPSLSADKYPPVYLYKNII